MAFVIASNKRGDNYSSTYAIGQNVSKIDRPDLFQYFSIDRDHYLS